MDDRVHFCLQKVVEAEGNLAAARGALVSLSQSTSDSDRNLNGSPFCLPTPRNGADKWDTYKSDNHVSIFDSSPTMLRRRETKSWKALDDSKTSIGKAMVDQVILDALAKQSELGVMDDLKDSIEREGSFMRSATGKPITPVGRTFTLQDIVWGHVGGVKIPLFHPEAKFLMGWMVLGFVFILYEAFSIPFFLAFDITPKSPTPEWIMANIINSYFILDIVCTFITCHLGGDGLVENRVDIIAKRYLTGWFILDVVASIPWEWMPVTTDSAKITRSVRFIRAFRLLRLTRLLRVMKLKAFLEKVEAASDSSTSLMFVIGIIRILGMLYGITHWAACCWYTVGNMDRYPETWIKANIPAYISAPGEKYIYCMYFTLTTMTTVGYGDITPQNYVEVCFTLFLLCIASIVFAGQMGTLADLISSINHHSHLKNEKKMTLARYMRWRGVPWKLAASVRQYLVFLWDTNEGNDAYEEDLKQQLPPVLKTELCYHVYGSVLYSAPFFKWMTDFAICVKSLASVVQTIFLERGDYLFRMGDQNTQIYVLINGRVWLTRNDNLFEGEDNVLVPEVIVNTPAGFAIPRKKDKNPIFGVANMMQSAQENKVAAVVNAFKVKKNSIPVEEPIAPSRGGGSEKLGVRSDVLKRANAELQARDMMERKAAIIVQKRWRSRVSVHERAQEKNAKLRKGSTTPVSTSPARSPARPQEDSTTVHLKKAIDEDDQPQTVRRNSLQKDNLNHLQSKTLSAPAYFGESCLWVPSDEWNEEPPPYLYTTRCTSRCEFVYIERREVGLLIDRFSPWLKDRFEFYRQGVVKSHWLFMTDGKQTGPKNGACETQQAWPQEPPDWAAADLTMGDDDVSMAARHYQVLRRIAEQAEPACSRDRDRHRNATPAVPRKNSRLWDGLRKETYLHPTQRLEVQRSARYCPGVQCQ